MSPPTLSDVEVAFDRIQSVVKKTPVLTCEALNYLIGAKLFFKCENFQKVGAFKMRGAANVVLSLSAEEAKKGVATHSSGNHGQALALAARLRGIPAHIVMPNNTPAVKKAAVSGYGGLITYCEPTLQAREAALSDIVTRTGASIVHPFDDVRVISGQGTVAYELFMQVPDLEMVLAPVGGGGLLSGTALVAKSKLGVKVYGAEPALADDAFRSYQDGRLYPTTNSLTIADGLRGSLSELTFSIIREHADGILLASEESIKTAFKLILERMKIVIEPSAALPLAVLLENKERFANQRIGLILTGGNVDLPVA